MENHKMLGAEEAVVFGTEGGAGPALHFSTGVHIRRAAELPFIEGDEIRCTWLSFLKDDRSIHWSRPMALVVLGSALQYAGSPAGETAACAASPV
jgi:hypothetical protein